LVSFCGTAGTAKLLPGYNPATWMLEVTGGAMATLTPANASVDWPATHLASGLCQANASKAEALIEQVSWPELHVLGKLRLHSVPSHGGVPVSML
jgi:hypothetical protein